jgi:hypothetical protein
MAGNRKSEIGNRKSANRQLANRQSAVVNRHCRLPHHNPAFQPVVIRILVIVKAAYSDSNEIPRLTALAGRYQADLVEFLAVGVIGVWIRRYVVTAGVIVDKDDA